VDNHSDRREGHLFRHRENYKRMLIKIKRSRDVRPSSTWLADHNKQWQQ